ncbi:hypothetical protein A2Z23_02505 [Candidatus Curtissbacteria bacterium RBG_16_39_7]|uniref:Uncharacterized protein n=1 Tax=Candidatus Curtissbacteria bacterium RBG_16_39_7 TaxID=1797707 RepID=A0A1F5G1E2_9BACT|nr:MAG: hypothetical protein A2Z23_02505 [Candidatus Curtissbacteria bacterium RBG_16_39_7]
MTETKERTKWLEPDWRALVGCDLEQNENGDTFRGPIKRIEVKEEGQPGKEYQWLQIYLDWVAIRSKDGWRLFKEPEDPNMGISITGVNLDFTVPFRNVDGSVRLTLPYLGSTTIHPPGKNLKRKDLLS